MRLLFLFQARIWQNWKLSLVSQSITQMLETCPSPRDYTFLAKHGACMWSNTSCSHLSFTLSVRALDVKNRENELLHKQAVYLYKRGEQK